MNTPRHTPGKRLLLLAALALASIMTTPAAASAEPIGGASPAALPSTGRRPAEVPRNYVLTPQGYLDPHCVITLADDETVLAERRGEAVVAITNDPATRSQGSTPPAIHPTGIVRRHIAPCAHPRWTREGRRTTPTPRSAPSSTPTTGTPRPAALSNPFTGWAAYASAATGAMSYLYAQWNVPAAPAVRAGQTVYLFPGLQSLSGATPIIMQPVLAWNQTGSGIPGWSISSWNCCSVGNAYHSAYRAVTGHTVSGEVWGDDCDPGTGICANWQISTYDWGSDEVSTLVTSSGGRVMDWTFGGALEAWNLSSCRQLPLGPVTFSHLDLRDGRGRQVTPTLSSFTTNQQPGCGYTARGTGSGATISWLTQP